MRDLGYWLGAVIAVLLLCVVALFLVWLLVELLSSIQGIR